MDKNGERDFKEIASTVIVKGTERWIVERRNLMSETTEDVAVEIREKNIIAMTEGTTVIAIGTIDMVDTEEVEANDSVAILAEETMMMKKITKRNIFSAETRDPCPSFRY